MNHPSADWVVPVSYTHLDGAYAVLTAGAATFALQILIKKYKIARLKEWSLTFSMLIGTLAAYFISLI